MFGEISDDRMLRHNRERAQALLRTKRRIAVTMVAVGIAVIFVTPPPYGKWAWVSVLVVGIVLMGLIETKRVLIFRADLRERTSNLKRDD